VTAVVRQRINASGPIRHNNETVTRVHALTQALAQRGICTEAEAAALFAAADRLTRMAQWLVINMTYARQVYLDGREPAAADFKSAPKGHTESSFRMVPLYVGHLLANALSRKTRAWVSGLGQSCAAVDAVNVLTRNLEPEQLERYPLSDAGLSRLCQDYFSFEVGAEGELALSTGGGLNALTAGASCTGAVSGYVELQYVHMPLPGQELVAFLSDSAYESQRGIDWAPEWWRGEDSGLVLPMLMVDPSRRSAPALARHAGGVRWYREQLEANGYDVIDIDSADPAAVAWCIITMSERLQEEHRRVIMGETQYPVRLPCALAVAGQQPEFPCAANPAAAAAERSLLAEQMRLLYVERAELEQACATLMCHEQQQRPAARDHWLRRLRVSQPVLPTPPLLPLYSKASAMEVIDVWFSQLVEANPFHRIRVADPGGLRDNRLNYTLDRLQQRVTAPAEHMAESLNGSVITAGNEEAVIAAALGNKQGLNLVVCHEAGAVKMLSAMHQEVIFARQMTQSGRHADWLAVPVIATSHTWENGGGRHGGQSPALSESWLEEMSDTAPVLFPCDAVTAVVGLERLYCQHGRIAVMVAPKTALPVVCTDEQALIAADEGFVIISHDIGARMQLIAIGAYQLQSVLRAAERIRADGVPCSVVAITEPGRFRIPRDRAEAAYVHSDTRIRELIPDVNCRIIVTHTHADIMTGVLRRLDKGAANTRFIGYRNHGGTLDVFGMMYANGQTWAHIVRASEEMLGSDCVSCMRDAEYRAVTGRGNPDILR
jgi:phosphoketolase